MNSADGAGGYLKDVGYPSTQWTMHEITINITDLTMQDRQPESAGGRMKWGELKAVYQGIGAYIKELEYDELKIDFWRVAIGGFPKRLRRVKHLGYGSLRVTPGMPDSTTPAPRLATGFEIEVGNRMPN
ncbi:MAG: hypothetical protein Q9198_002255 [Flavoplaca austrocitrina]